MYAVVVTITTKPGQFDAFLGHMLENARASRQEPACQQFDVCTDPDIPDTMFLYELYDDRAGFEAHMQTDHYKKMDSYSEQMIAEKVVQFYRTVA